MNINFQNFDYQAYLRGEYDEEDTYEEEITEKVYTFETFNLEEYLASHSDSDSNSNSNSNSEKVYTFETFNLEEYLASHSNSEKEIPIRVIEKKEEIPIRVIEKKEIPIRVIEKKEIPIRVIEKKEEEPVITEVPSPEAVLLYQFISSQGESIGYIEELEERYGKGTRFCNKEVINAYLGFNRMRIYRIIKANPLLFESISNINNKNTTNSIVRLNPDYEKLLDVMPNFEEMGRNRLAFRERNSKNYKQVVFNYILENPEVNSITKIEKGTGVYFYAVREALFGLKNLGLIDIKKTSDGLKIDLRIDNLSEEKIEEDFKDLKDKLFYRIKAKRKIGKLSYSKHLVMGAINTLGITSTRKDELFAKKKQLDREIEDIQSNLPQLKRFWNITTVNEAKIAFRKLARYKGEIKDKLVRALKSSLYYHDDTDILDFNGELKYWDNINEDFNTRYFVELSNEKQREFRENGIKFMMLPKFVA